MADAEGELQQIGAYTVERLLLHGQRSSLYLSQKGRKAVVIRVCHRPLATTEAQDQFLMRAKHLKKLKHRSIIDIYDYGLVRLHNEEYDCGYLVMQYVQGESLRQRIAPGQRMAADEVKRVLSPVASALHYAHVQQIVHANLHPGNLLYSSTNEIMLTGFSLFLEDLAASPDQSVIALPYMPPEQLHGAPLPASDQYALAVMAYELLCGCRPYDAVERDQLLDQQEHLPLPGPRVLNSAISPAVESVLLHALHIDPNERFPTIQDFADQYLHALMGAPVKLVNAKGAHVIVPVPASKPVSLPVIPEAEPAPALAALSQASANALHDQDPQNGHVDSKQQDKQLRTGKRATNIPAVEDFMLLDESNVQSDLDDDFYLPEADEEGKRMHFVTGPHLLDTVVAELGQGGVLSQRLPGYEERPAQIEMASVVAHALTYETKAIVEASTGTGKALDVDTPIPTPTGWKRMGDLIVGDLVFDEKGNQVRVTAAFDVMHGRPCYKVVFSDGSSLIADAEHEWASYTAVDRSWAKLPKTDVYKAKNFVTSGKLAMLNELITLSSTDDAISVDEAKLLIGGHQWSVFQAAHKIEAVNANKRPARFPRLALLTAVRERLAKDLSGQRRDGRAYTLVTTEQMAATLTVSSIPRANHAIAVACPLELPEVDLPIAPYFLGVWLGDGNSRNNQTTTADPDQIGEIEKDGYTVRSLKHSYLYAVDDENGKAVSRWQPGMTGRLRSLGLWRNKHIPAIYLRASILQRRALLAGLLDTDGTVSRTGAIEFTTTSPRLAQDVYELACSLGYRPTLRSGRARLKGKDCGPKWTLAFTTEEQVFRLQRKVNAHRERLRNYSYERNCFRYVVAIHEVPSRPVRCVQVDSPSHLYLAGQAMIPTHNSLAYLLPIVRSGHVAIISTANKALQEQLYYKDIPFIQQHIKHVEAVLYKGMGNYVCLDRLETERNGMQFYTKNREFTRLIELTLDEHSGFNGDFETLDFQLPADLRSRVGADSEQCAWKKCNYYNDCYIREMRAKAERAQLIVVNHTLLLLDAAMDGYFLPQRDVIIVDEAHHLEEEATRAFTITVSPNSIRTLLNQRMLKDHSQISLQDDAEAAMMKAWEQLRATADPGFKGRANLQEPLEEGLKLATIIADIANSLLKHKPINLSEKDEQLYNKLVKRAQNLADNIRTVFSVADRDRFVYYVERMSSGGQRGVQLQVSAAPLDVTEWLRERLFNKSNVICTSATLATIGASSAESNEPGFAYFRRRVGLDPVNYPDVEERILPLTFDYESNALLYVPRDLPEPAYGAGSDEYIKALARKMYDLVKCSRGRAFLLFSSKRALDRSFELMAPHLDFPLLKQGDLSRIELTRRFREEEGSVLFGLKSFWEGVDIAGDALSLVVIDKLPFDPPDDPVHEARVAQMKAAGENWFGTYVLPQAVLRLKQGLGRLLRTREDRGVMAILDVRLYTKGYGRLVLDTLPPARRTSDIREVKRFFDEELD